MPGVARISAAMSSSTCRARWYLSACTSDRPDPSAGRRCGPPGTRVRVPRNAGSAARRAHRRKTDVRTRGSAAVARRSSAARTARQRCRRPPPSTKPAAMHADRRKHKIAGGAPSLAERAKQAHESAITMQSTSAERFAFPRARSRSDFMGLSQYSTRTRKSPWAGAVWTAWVRRAERRIASTCAGVSLPCPTATSAPTRLRTIL